MQKRRYTIIETIAGGAIMGVVFCVAMTTVSMLKKMQREFVQESRAIQVIDNVVERLAAEKRFDQHSIDLLMKQEFDAMTIPAKARLQTTCSATDTDYVLTIMKRENEAPLARVKIPKVASREAQVR